MVFLGKNVEIHATPELAQLEIGRWVHIGDKNTIRAHEDRCGWGQGGAGPRQRRQLLSGHRIRRFRADGGLVLRLRLRPQDGQHEMATKDQGIVKSPVRSGRTSGWRRRHHSRGTRDRPRLRVMPTRSPGDIPDYRLRLGPRRRWSRTGKWGSDARRRSARSWLPRYDIERKKAPLTVCQLKTPPDQRLPPNLGQAHRFL